MKRVGWVLPVLALLLLVYWFWPRAGVVPDVAARAERAPPARSDPRQVLVWKRTPVAAEPIAAEPVAADPAKTPDSTDLPEVQHTSDVHTLDLSTLPPEVLQMRLDEGTQALQQLVDACEEHAAEPLKVLAAVVLDERGLQEITLSAYDDDPERTESWATDDPLPEALVTCLEEEVWNTAWEGTAQNTVLPLALSMRMGQD